MPDHTVDSATPTIVINGKTLDPTRFRLNRATSTPADLLRVAASYGLVRYPTPSKEAQ